MKIKKFTLYIILFVFTSLSLSFVCASTYGNNPQGTGCYGGDCSSSSSSTQSSSSTTTSNPNTGGLPSRTPYLSEDRQTISPTKASIDLPNNTTTNITKKAIEESQIQESKSSENNSKNEKKEEKDTKMNIKQTSKYFYKLLVFLALLIILYAIYLYKKTHKKKQKRKTILGKLKRKNP